MLVSVVGQTAECEGTVNPSYARTNFNFVIVVCVKVLQDFRKEIDGKELKDGKKRKKLSSSDAEDMLEGFCSGEKKMNRKDSKMVS